MKKMELNKLGSFCSSKGNLNDFCFFGRDCVVSCQSDENSASLWKISGKKADVELISKIEDIPEEILFVTSFGEVTNAAILFFFLGFSNNFVSCTGERYYGKHYRRFMDV